MALPIARRATAAPSLNYPRDLLSVYIAIAALRSVFLFFLLYLILSFKTVDS
jgi:hypothetical protein